ncbi:SbtR family transcriptional regulator [Longispora fulva]|uniref:Transcriptional regulator SbtR-like C-terminal domain-containing protein n=1 Tax=Longispora fulva TaxID=619741 RepID=A0A8J7GCQ7_9ACTN|nr:hypothetical protein [Longispora fulva]MBG6134047.1 hypothetical protein [Longispora fulva]
MHTLVDRAREHGAVRADVTGEGIVLLTCAPNCVANVVTDAPPDLWRRYLDIVSTDSARRPPMAS